MVSKTVSSVKVVFVDGSEKEFQNGFLFGVGENGGEFYGVVRSDNGLLNLENAVLEKAAHILNQRAKVAINLLTQTREIGEEKEEE
jgi:hypothetical protein